MKAAVTFRGIGYHTDKTLLYYGKKLAKESGYQIIEVNYTGFPRDVKGNEENCQRLKLILKTYEGANHSLETGHCLIDLKIMNQIFECLKQGKEFE